MPNTDAAIKELLDALQTVTTELKERTVGYAPESTNRAIAEAEKLLLKYAEPGRTAKPRGRRSIKVEDLNAENDG
jgi:hypothetical protein